jgi:hypothetical protein
MWLMNIPNHETIASNTFFAPRGRAWIMINDQWPKIKEDIDNGRLSPIGLIEVDASIDPFRMGENHQVLAWGYKLDGPNLTDLTIHVYDPNFQNDDSVAMSLSIADPQHTTDITYSYIIGGSRIPVPNIKIWCFFRPEYSFSSPPPAPTPIPSKCFIATAACGADTFEVSVLRNFRDQWLLTNSQGRVIVKLYESLSPPIAAIIAKSTMLRAITRKLIVFPAYQIAKSILKSHSNRHQ